MSVRIQLEIMATSVRAKVRGKQNAHYLEKQVREAEFDDVVVKQPASGVEGINLWQVIVGRKPGGTVSDIVDFLKSSPNFEVASFDRKKGR
jgi:hypothetical protein